MNLQFFLNFSKNSKLNIMIKNVDSKESSKASYQIKSEFFKKIYLILILKTKKNIKNAI